MNDLYVISGVSGMTGNELARQLVSEGNFVLGFDNFFASSVESIKDLIGNKNFLFYKFDINNGFEMQNVECFVKSNKYKYNKLIYINCAAVVHTEHFYNVYSTYETNVESMRKFLDQAIRCNADIFINCSTSEVYSMQSWNDDGGVKENDFLLMSTAEHSQRTSYATGKLLTEFFMKDAVDNNRIKGCSIRFANVYSNRERFAKHIIPHIFSELIKNKSVTLLENSKVNKRSFLHNIDSCRAVLSLINNSDALDGTVYNVATDEEVSIIHLVELIAQKLSIKKPVIKFDGYRLSDPERRILNTDKIRRKTNWAPIITLDKGLSMCAEQYLKL